MKSLLVLLALLAGLVLATVCIGAFVPPVLQTFAALALICLLAGLCTSGMERAAVDPSETELND